MSRYEQILTKLNSTFAPVHIELADESHMHSVPKGAESHFKLLLVSEKFAGQSRVARSRLITECLAFEMKNGIQALSQRTYTPEEWAKLGGSVEMESPACAGAAKRQTEK